MRLPLWAAAVLVADLSWAGAARIGEIALPGETPGLKTGSAPSISLQLNPVSGLLPAGPAALTPSLFAPSALAPSVIPVGAPLAAAPVALAPSRAAAAKPLDALTQTGAALSAAKPESDGHAQALDALFTGGAARGGAPSVASGPEPVSPAAALAPSRPASKKRMPAGVAKAFQNSAVLGGGMAALSAGMWATLGQPSLAAFALIGFPLVLIPLHFALVSAFWASRYWGYPKLGEGGKSAFRAAWTALSLAYPAAAVAGLAAWLIAIAAASPALLALFGLPFLVALGEVAHHFVYRGPAERSQDKGKPFLDWRSRLGGNIGQQLARMRRKP